MDVAVERTFEVAVSYNGVAKTFRVRPDELVGKLLRDAVAAFGITQNPHTQALFTPDGVELNDAQSLESAGIKAGEDLLLRPSTVKGG